MDNGYYRNSPSFGSHLHSLNNPSRVNASGKIFDNTCFCYNLSMYNNGNQYPNQSYQSTYPQYQQNYNPTYGYQGYEQTPYVPTNVQPIPPGEEYPSNNWAPVGGYHNNVAPNFDPKNQDEAVAQERKAQNAQLIKQRQDYVGKAKLLGRELELLRNQKHQIMSESSNERDMDRIIKENSKLQDEIQTKLKAIYNVIEMLSSIIKDGRSIADLQSQLDDSPKIHHNKSNNKHDLDDSSVKYNYMHYDPELHWCRLCDEFPKTAKDYLLHLQSDLHKTSIQENDVGDNTPWHKLLPEQELPTHEGAPKKRIPIRGLQFFISAPAWYCKLCDTWIGDLHCASHHLKSQAHFQNYAQFVEQNPHWEIEWLKDREKALARGDRHSSDSETDKKKKKKKRSSVDPTGKDKKRKKRSKKRRKHSSDTSSSSSSSDSSSDEEDQTDKSKSIRVVMRNMKVQSIMNEDLTGKWEMLERLVDEHKKKEEASRKPAEEAVSQWMTVSAPPQPADAEKALLESLKGRMKQKQEAERAKHAELERRQREQEREERELNERRVREEQEAKERFDRERRERDREEYERIRDKDRNAVRFKPRDGHRKRRSPTPPSPDRRRRARKTRSRSRDRKKAAPAKRLPFIGRMPLFKHKKAEDRVEKEIKKEDYDIPRVTRFQPGNLAKAFLPQPDVVCFPKLSSYPPIAAPPPPPAVTQPDPPDPPMISEEMRAPPAPIIGAKVGGEEAAKEDVVQSEGGGVDANLMGQYYDYNMMYSQMYDYSQYQQEEGQQQVEKVPLAHTMPLQPPPLPPNDPNDDLAMLGISADDMAAQSF